jgi:hypothetical protein
LYKKLTKDKRNTEREKTKSKTIHEQKTRQKDCRAPTGWYMLHVGGSIPPGPTVLVFVFVFVLEEPRG